MSMPFQSLIGGGFQVSDTDVGRTAVALMFSTLLEGSA